MKTALKFALVFFLFFTTWASASWAQFSVVVPIRAGAMWLGPFAYGPNPLYIHSGTWVTWTNLDSMPHTVTSLSGFWSSGYLFPGQSYQGYFSVLGSYPYYCSIHGFGSMNGSIVVVP